MQKLPTPTSDGDDFAGTGQLVAASKPKAQHHATTAKPSDQVDLLKSDRLQIINEAKQFSYV